MADIATPVINLVFYAGKTVADRFGLGDRYAIGFSIAIVVIIFLIIVIIFSSIFGSSSSKFVNLITPKGEIPYTREFSEMPLQTAADVSLYKDGKCLCNSSGSCDYCLDTSMEERTDHINHMVNRRPPKLYRTLSQQHDNVVFDVDKSNLDYKLNDKNL